MQDLISGASGLIIVITAFLCLLIGAITILSWLYFLMLDIFTGRVKYQSTENIQKWLATNPVTVTGPHGDEDEYYAEHWQCVWNWRQCLGCAC